MNCYSCEYKEYKEGNQVPGTRCPSDCTIINLLGGASIAYTSLPFSVQQLVRDRYPELVDTFSTIIKETE